MIEKENTQPAYESPASPSEATVETAPAMPATPGEPSPPAAPAPLDKAAPGAPRDERHPFFTVGIGASAGGLEALAELVRNVPLDHIAYIVVQHLSPNHESVLTELLARESRISVQTAKEGIVVEPNYIYIIPPNTDLALTGGVIHLVPPTGTHGPRLPIDFFFRSLAEDQGASAIGVILSGTGSDGTLGLKAIKAAGGITFAQEPTSAKYDGMPRSALASGATDFCLTPREIAEELSRISANPQYLRTRLITPDARDREPMARLFALVRAQYGNDLSYYKSTTVERRTERRMMLLKISRLDEYVSYVQANPDELHSLYKDMLITVTNFFRDREPFDLLKSRVFPQILESKTVHAPIRIWVPACATGEEAYSLAIALVEFLEDKAEETKIQIFATDVDEDAVQHARQGVYPQNIALDVSPDRLSRFFVRREGDYCVTRAIRDRIVFSKQNLLKDAPFSRIDLVSCRNLLIYLQPSLQWKALRVMHFALNPTGFLLLGSSESVGDAPDLFSMVDRKTKLFSKKPLTLSSLPHLDYGPRATSTAVVKDMARPSVNVHALADRKVVDLYGPPGVVVNEGLDVIQFRGRVGPYLDPQPGAASFNLMRLARPELHMELRRAVERAFAENQRVSSDFQFASDAGPIALRLDVIPLTIREPEGAARCLLVLFHRLPAPERVQVMAPTEAGEPDERLVVAAERTQALERELTVTKDYLQLTIDENESANEELKSANEELQSSIEELQSANEELETSKEEMQSTNEELITVNEELQNRMTEHRQTNDDLLNVLAGVDMAIVIVGMDLRIRRYTAVAEKLLHLVPADIGRPVDFIEHFCGGELRSKVAAVTETLRTLEEDVFCSNQHWYSLRILPYKTRDHSIRGAVITLSDIDARKRASELSRDLGRYAGKFLGGIGHPLVIVDAAMRVGWANDHFLQFHGLGADEVLGRPLVSLAKEWGGARMRDLIGEALQGTPFRGEELRIRVADGPDRTVRVGASRVPLPDDTMLALLSIEEEPGSAPESSR